MTNKFSNKDKTIDSRDIIDRIDELECERDNLDEGSNELREWDEENAEELETLKKLASQAESSPDWNHGETLIRESYFTEYITDLIHECYEMPEAINSGEWPYRHMSIDYEAAADEAKGDYIEVDFDGVTYLIRA